MTILTFLSTATNLYPTVWTIYKSIVFSDGLKFILLVFTPYIDSFAVFVTCESSKETETKLFSNWLGTAILLSEICELFVRRVFRRVPIFIHRLCANLNPFKLEFIPVMFIHISLTLVQGDSFSFIFSIWVTNEIEVYRGVGISVYFQEAVLSLI